MISFVQAYSNSLLTPSQMLIVIAIDRHFDCLICFSHQQQATRVSFFNLEYVSGHSVIAVDAPHLFSLNCQTIPLIKLLFIRVVCIVYNSTVLHSDPV